TLVAAREQPVLTWFAGPATSQSPRPADPAVGYQRDRDRLERLQIPLDALATRPVSPSSAVSTLPVATHPEAEGPLEGRYRRVAGVGHGGVHPAHTGPARATALTPADRLVVDPPPPADHHVVHRSLAGCSKPSGRRLGED